jgi:DNA-binding response OmpR family regulator
MFGSNGLPLATPTVLVIDDDRMQLQLTSHRLKKANFRVVNAVITGDQVSFPEHELPVAILLDYRLNCSLTTPEIAMVLRERFPSIPIFLLSALDTLPKDVAGLVQGFIKKGDVQNLLATLQEITKAVEKGF